MMECNAPQGGLNGSEGAEAPKLQDLIDLSYRAEREAMRFYEGLSERFRHLPEIAAFWRELAADEEEHVEIVDEIRAQLSDQDLQRPVDAGLMAKAAQFLSFSAPEALAGIHTLEDAYRFSVNLEYSELNKLLSMLVDDTVAEEAERLRINAAVHEHQGKFKKFAAIFGDSVWRRGIEAIGPRD